MAVDLKTQLNITDNEIDIVTRIMRGDNIDSSVLDESIKKKAGEGAFTIGKYLLNKAQEIAKRAKEGTKAPPKTADTKAPDIKSPTEAPKSIEPPKASTEAPKNNLPATQGTRDITAKPTEAPKSGLPATQGTREVANPPSGGKSVATPNSTNNPISSLNKPPLKDGKTILPYDGIAVGSVIGGAAATSLLSRSAASPQKDDNKPKVSGIGSDSVAAPNAGKSPVNINPVKPDGMGGIGSDSARAPNTNTNMRVVPTRPKVAAPSSTSPNSSIDIPEPTVKPPSNVSFGGGDNTKAPTSPSTSTSAKAPTKVIRQGAIVQQKKELSADDLNAISSNLAKGKDAGSSGALDEPMAKEKISAAENIKKRLRQLNKEETDFDKMSEKKNKGKYTPVDEPAEKIENKRKPVKFGEPGTEKMSKEDIDIVIEAAASASHTGKIKSSKRIIKTLEKSVESGEAKDFQFENGTTVTIQPAMARMAVSYYNKLSDFQKAQAAKLMRQSFRDFLSIAKRK